MQTAIEDVTLPLKKFSSCRMTKEQVVSSCTSNNTQRGDKLKLKTSSGLNS
jgi:hypothetical protein